MGKKGGLQRGMRRHPEKAPNRYGPTEGREGDKLGELQGLCS